MLQCKIVTKSFILCSGLADFVEFLIAARGCLAKHPKKGTRNGTNTPSRL